jgi:hypothetical protein
MTLRPAPPWLEALQQRFSSVIRTPLDRSTLTLRATPDRYDPAAVRDALDGPRTPASERLAVYNRQYWFRLFTVLQTAFPITVRLVGYWRFNELASRFLLARPPTSWDIDRAPDGFERFLEDTLVEGETNVSRDALVDASRVDSAWRGVFRAPEVPPFEPSPAQAARLLDLRLVPSPASAIVFERWPLIALKATLASAHRDGAVALPERLSEPRAWALVREPNGVRQLPLEALEASLFTLLAQHTVRDALALLEQSCADDSRASLPANTQRWLARSVALGLWAGVAEP